MNSSSDTAVKVVIKSATAKMTLTARSAPDHLDMAQTIKCISGRATGEKATQWRALWTDAYYVTGLYVQSHCVAASEILSKGRTMRRWSLTALQEETQQRNISAEGKKKKKKAGSKSRKHDGHTVQN
jgi:hypothetical protein